MPKIEDDAPIQLLALVILHAILSGVTDMRVANGEKAHYVNTAFDWAEAFAKEAEKRNPT